MSDSETDPLKSLLSSFALGPSWARAAGDTQDKSPKKSFAGDDDRPRRRDDRGDRGGDRGARDDRGGGARRPFQDRNRRFEERPPRQEEIGPEEGVRVTISPDAQAVHLIGKEIHQVARVYALFDVAKILLAEKARVRAIFETSDSHAPLILGRRDECLFLTREEAARHLWNSDKRAEYVEEETIEVAPPTGNFQAIARCGISGEWLGPVNFHSYQTNLRRLHRERFARMPFELYAAKVRTERGEEAVNAWLETQKTKIRWRIVGEESDDAWMTDRAEAERAVATRCFDQAFEETRIADVSGAIDAKNISPSLLMSLKFAGTHARRHPAVLIPAVCRAVEAEHLPVFKRQGKLHTGPARPHPLAADAVLAERPAQMVAWIRENPPAKLEGLWKSVLPEGSTAPPSEFAADLFWLLHQGHILLHTDDTLVVQEFRDTPAAPGEGKKKRKKKKKNRPETPEGEAAPVDGEIPADTQPTTEAPDASDQSEAAAEPTPTSNAAELTEQSAAAESLAETPVDAPAHAPVPVEDSAEPAAETPAEASPEISDEAPPGTSAEPSPGTSAEPVAEAPPETPVETATEPSVESPAQAPDSVEEAPEPAVETPTEASPEPAPEAPAEESPPPPHAPDDEKPHFTD